MASVKEGVVKEWSVQTVHGRDVVRIVDRYENEFKCRVGAISSGRRAQDWKQPVLSSSGDDSYSAEITTRFGCDQTECRGIDYVEFHCPVGTAERIALFYESVLDATTAVVPQVEASNRQIAIIAFGNIDDQGRADQSLLFRESDTPIAPYDGHHIAMYIGETAADYERAFANAKIANIVWCNPRFSDQVQDLEGARQCKQFRFKDIIDMKTGDVIFELEHEMRSIEHESWPGPR